MAYERFAAAKAREALADTPVVMLAGPRQAGKTTLAQALAGHDRAYLTLDEAAVRAAALDDPAGFIRGLDRVVIDEVQRAPDLLIAIKQAVDTDRRPGRFLLTGSANVMTIPRVAESLAGRMEVVTLLPLSQGEILSQRPRFIEHVLRGEIPRTAQAVTGHDLVDAVLAGGFPEAIARTSPRRRRDWFRAYVDAIVQRDVREVATVEKLGEMPRLLRALAEHSGKLTNFSEVGSRVGLDAKTAQRYASIFEQVYLLVRLEPWFTNRLKRLTRSAKLHFIDSGLLGALLGTTVEGIAADRARFGALLETFVVAELLKQATWAEGRVLLHHLRDREDTEVDVLIEAEDGGGLVGVEVKASATVTGADFRGLRRLAASHPEHFRMGVVLYDGGTIVPFGERLFAAPVGSLWG